MERAMLKFAKKFDAASGTDTSHFFSGAPCLARLPSLSHMANHVAVEPDPCPVSRLQLWLWSRWASCRKCLLYGQHHHGAAEDLQQPHKSNKTPAANSSTTCIMMKTFETV